ncbi:signal recognition particle receptor subunit alpha, partial [Candidatus Micrarchaeota archaeon]|nr:signal recognition particle receptor subunit alpha [Candidatus Micrarchaeota archaeon]
MLDLLKGKLTGFIDSFSKEADKKLEVNLSLESKVKGLVFDEIEIQEKDVDDLLYNLELSLLEADVSLEVSSYLVNCIKQKVVGKKIKKNEVQNMIKQIIKDSLIEMIPNPPDFINDIKHREKPVKILFLGPNGAGKTTTIAKLVSLLKTNGLSSVISASDTFRAAAIEQT